MAETLGPEYAGLAGQSDPKVLEAASAQIIDEEINYLQQFVKGGVSSPADKSITQGVMKDYATGGLKKPVASKTKGFGHLW